VVLSLYGKTLEYANLDAHRLLGLENYDVCPRLRPLGLYLMRNYGCTHNESTWHERERPWLRLTIKNYSNSSIGDLQLIGKCRVPRLWLIDPQFSLPCLPEGDARRLSDYVSKYPEFIPKHWILLSRTNVEIEHSIYELLIKGKIGCSRAQHTRSRTTSSNRRLRTVYVHLIDWNASINNFKWQVENTDSLAFSFNWERSGWSDITQHWRERSIQANSSVACVLACGEPIDAADCRFGTNSEAQSQIGRWRTYQVGQPRNSGDS